MCKLKKHPTPSLLVEYQCRSTSSLSIYPPSPSTPHSAFEKKRQKGITFEARVHKATPKTRRKLTLRDW